MVHRSLRVPEVAGLPVSRFDLILFLLQVSLDRHYCRGCTYTVPLFCV